MLACHSDLLLRWMVDGSVKKEDLPSMIQDKSIFQGTQTPAAKDSTKRKRATGGGGSSSGANKRRTGAAGSGRGGDEDGGGGGREIDHVGGGGQTQPTEKRRVPLIGRKLISANLSGTKLDEARGKTSEEWKVIHSRANWEDFYYKYIVPLAKLCRALRKSYTTRQNDDELVKLAKEYTRGFRELFGREYMVSKGLWHRLMHIIHQAPGRGGREGGREGRKEGGKEGDRETLFTSF